MNKPTQLALLIAVCLQADRADLAVPFLTDLYGYPKEAVDIELIQELLSNRMEAR